MKYITATVNFIKKNMAMAFFILGIIFLISNLITKDGIVNAIESSPLSKTETKEVKPSCTPTEAKIILDGASLLKDANYVVLNLDNFKLTRTAIKGDKEYKYYSQYGKDDIYYTIARDYVRELIRVDENITKAK